ncbi:amino acid adenylation domain-containing protein [Nocardia sp. NPDC050406]|uniref:amino acid adenylation domain-containing protein n=1 Tax=Nocardia sp. NPDC050406 TaxID=3364318 RepID=UPI0037B7609F
MSNEGKSVLELRRELLRRRMAEKGVAAAATTPAPVRRAQPGEPQPLSAGQRRMWFLQTRDPEDATLNICVAYRLSGPVDAQRLHRAVTAVVARHDILRTTYGLGDDGEPYQVVRSDLEFGWQVHDLTDLPEASRDRRLEVLARRDFGRAFDLSTESPLRISLARTAVDEFTLILTIHHISWDDDSWSVFFADLNAAYNDSADLPALPGQFVDVEVLGDTAAESEAEIDYWRRTLRPLPESLELPGKSAGAGTKQAERVTHALPGELVERVETFARQRSASPFMVLLAAFDAVVHRYTAATDFLVSVPVTVRRGAAAESLIGYFGNTLLLRATFAPGATFGGFVDGVREICLGAFAHQTVGIDRVVREANPERLGGRDGLEQLVRIGFSVRKSADGFALDGVRSTQLELGSPVAQVSLGLTVVLEPEGAYLEAEYRVDELERGLVEQLLGHYVRLLDAALAEPERRIADIDMLGEADRTRLRELSRGEWVDGAPTTLVALFENQVAATPDALAVVAPDVDVELTYADLNRRSNRLAHWLIAQGVGSEDIVGLRLSNSVEFLVAVLGVLKAGGAYLPIDPAYPDDRIDYLVEDARPRLVLGRVELDAAEEAAVGHPETDPVDADRIRPLRPHNLAYVIYTSGSTGKPKGVPVPHDAIAEHLEGFVAQWGMTAEDRLLQSSSVSFDASLLDIFVTLTQGARLVVPKPDAFRDIPYVAEVITRCGVTVLHMVPSMLSTFLLLPEVNEWRALRHVPVGGEALPGEVADKFAGVFDAELRNHYGPTEAVVCATHMNVEGPQGNGIVPIGVPNRNVYVYLLDEALQLVPDGVVGEIYLGGAQLARGYLNRAALSAERFVADPFLPGARLYRTGDLARRNAKGEIEFVGRADEQVKVRGFRIELGEVEATISAHPSVGHCVVVTVEDSAVGAMLAAYVVPAAGVETVDLDAVRAHAAATLPEYMVPGAFAIIDEIPLTVHGKLDKRALPDPERRTTQSYREPATATEIRLAALFEQIFGREGVGADDSFFELGGHSLLATRLIVLIRSEFGVELDVRAPFDTPTVAGLAALIEGAPALTDIRPVLPLVKRERPQLVPLSYSQLAMWFQRRMEGPSAVGNIPFAIQVDGPLDIPALQAALGDVIARHEALRTVFPEDGGVPYQSVLPVGPVEIPVTVLDGPERLRGELAEIARYCFAVESELLIRPHIFVVGERTHAVSLLVHHMVADHWSFRTVLDDLAVAYRSRTESGTAPEWSAQPIDFADFTLWQRDTVESDSRQADYWRETLAGVPTETAVAQDRPRPAVLGKNGAVAPFAVPAALRQRLRELADAAGASEFMLYQAAVVTLMHKLGAGVDIPLGTPVAGRVDPAAADLVGLLANMVVLRNDLSGDPTLRTVLDRARDVALGAYGNQDLPIERVVDAVNPPRSRARNPLFQTMMHFREEDWAAADTRLGEAAITVLPMDFDISLLDLSINFFASPDGGFDASVIVNTDLYDPATGHLFGQRMLQVLTAFADNPDQPLSELDVMPAEERQRILHWSAGPATQPAPLAALGANTGTVPANRIAIRHGDETVSYGQLFAHLAAGTGAIAGDAAATSRYATMEVAVDQLLELLAARVAAASTAPDPSGISRNFAMASGDSAVVEALLPAGLAVSSADLSAAVSDRLTASDTARGQSGQVRLAALDPATIDLAIELLAAVADGATLIVTTDAQREDPTALVDLITKYNVAQVLADPAALARFVHTGVSVLPSVRYWEALGIIWPAALPDLLPALSADAVATFSYRVPGHTGAVARGPLTADGAVATTVGARVLVLDDHQRPAPPGVTGALYVGTAAATDGLVADPLEPGAFLRRTGEQARWTTAGTLALGAHEPARKDSTTDRAPATTATADSDTEAKLSAILAELLELEPDEVTGEDNFFALGGDSVISIQWAVRANEIGLPLSPQLVFEAMTVTELAAGVDEAIANGVTSEDIAAAFGGGGTGGETAPAEPEPAAPTHAPMSVSGLSQDALASLGAAWKGAQ